MLWAELMPQMRSWQPISKKMPWFLNAHVLRQLHHNSPAELFPSTYLCWKILVRPTGEPNGQDDSSGWFWPTKLFIVWSSQINKSNKSNSKANSKLNMHALNNLQTWVLCYLAAYACFSNLPLTVSLQKNCQHLSTHGDEFPEFLGRPAPPLWQGSAKGCYKINNINHVNHWQLHIVALLLHSTKRSWSLHSNFRSTWYLSHRSDAGD